MYHVEGLGQRIYWYRKDKGLTQQQFADLIGVTPQAISKWETNQGYPDVTLIPKVAEILGVRIDQLFGRSAEEDVQREAVSQELPESLGDSDLICIYGDYALYSNVPVKRFTAKKILFADNSEAFLEEISVTNRGSGVIRFVPIQLAMDYGSGIENEDEAWSSESDGEVIKAMETDGLEPEVLETEEFLVEVEEPTFTSESSRAVTADEAELFEDTKRVYEEFEVPVEPEEPAQPEEPAELEEPADHVEEYIHDSRQQKPEEGSTTSDEPVRILRMNVPGKADVNVYTNPDLDVPFAWHYNGEGEPTIEFEDGDLRITMPSTFNSRKIMSFIRGLSESAKMDLAIRSDKLVHCGIRISGIGDVDVDIPIDHLNFELSGAGDASFSHVGSVKGSLFGAGDLDIQSAGDTEVEIKGAGDIEIKSIDGNLKFTIQGAGDVKIGSGYAPTADITISGAGDVNASRVTVGDLYCNITGPGDVTIGRVTGKSQERVEFMGNLKIHERGPVED